MSLGCRGSKRPQHRLISSRCNSSISSSHVLQNRPFSSIIMTFSYMSGVQLLLFSLSAHLWLLNYFQAKSLSLHLVICGHLAHTVLEKEDTFYFNL